MVWGLSISLYLFLAGMGAGSFILAVYWAFTSPDARRARLVGRVIAPCAVGVGLLLLMLDAEAGFRNPLRFFYLLTNFNSVMTWGVVILSLFMLTSVVALVLEVAKKPVPRALDIAGIVFSCATAVYTGVLLGAAESAFPLWNALVLPVLFAVSALSSGVAVTTLVASLVAKGQVPHTKLSERVAQVLPVAEAALIVVLLALTASKGAAGAQTVESLLFSSHALVFWGGLIVIGILFPLCIELVAARKANRSASGEGVTVATAVETSLLAAVCVLVGAVCLRYLVVASALPVCLGA